jgi:CHAT domain-containing protein
MSGKASQRSGTEAVLSPEALAALAQEDITPAAFFAAHPELCTSRTVDLLHDEVLRTVYADLKRAQRAAQAAAVLARELDDPAARAASLRALGHVYYAGSRYEEAVRSYTEALEILQPLGRDQESGRTLLSGLQSLIYLGDYEKAFAWAKRAQRIFQMLGDDLRLARLASNVGNILYRQDRYLEALAKYEEAYATLARLGQPRDVAAVLSNIAVCRISLGHFADALACYQQARDYCELHELPLLVAEADYNIAYVHYLHGDFLRAIELYKASRRHCLTGGDAYHAALCDLDEAEIYLELNLNSEAALLAQQAEAGFQALRMPYERGKALVIHAIAASRRGESRVTGLLLAKARRVFAGERNVLWPALIDLYRAILLERENFDRQAARLCRGAYRVLATSLLPGRAVLAELLQTRLLLKSGHVDGAREICARALARLEARSMPWLRCHAHLVQGQVEEIAGRQRDAFAAYESARREIEALRSRLWADEPKISFLKDKLEAYENLISAHLAGWGDAEDPTGAAFLCIQQAKSRSLADLILKRPAETPRDVEIGEIRRSLDTQYRHMEHLALSKSASESQMETLRHSIRAQESHLVRLFASAPSTPPGGETLSLDAIQAAIPADAALLEYYSVRGTLYVCLVTTKSLEIVSLCPVDAVRTSLRLLQFQMRKFRLGREDWRVAVGGLEEVADSHLRDLYRDLFASIRDRVTGVRHVIVAAHDFLHHLPFHALLGPSGYLIDQFTISYAPSATVFALCRNRAADTCSQSLVLGLPDRLAPSIEAEARTAAAALPNVRVFLGQEATEDALRRHGPASRFIHIATHGMFRRDNPLFSAIRLSDSRLTLLDLYNLSLSAELVVLSGCSTGLNVVVGGDELLGLMRGLLLAGAQSVMVCLWDVNDLSTARFMKYFYGSLALAENKASAVQAAMVELRREHQHPYYWAPFVLAGNYAGPITSTSHGGS